jgi:malto-oligosyltrehalose trehalohydrolase
MSVGFYFRKSWGAEPSDGGARFRLWAPSQERIFVRVAEGNRDLPMRQAGDGWFELETDAVKPGGGYSFVLADGMAVNDPAARAQVDGVNGPSRLIDPKTYEWRTADWRGRPWEEVVFYELHTGTFSPEGTFDGIRRKLDHLAETGITCIELLPVAQFGGNRGWGYDGVLLYAPHQAYGGPDALKRLVDEAHARGLMMFLDVVYNHFGPEGNYLSLYAPDFFHPENKTPWGAAIAYEKRPVRDFFIENALYWLEEYRFDGLRLDAVDQVAKQSKEPVLEEIAEAIRARIPDRHIHLTTEDERNITSLHERDEQGRVKLYSGEWNDDVHHVFHTAATGEREGYYLDYADDPVGQLARALATGFVYQGEPSPHHEGRPRGVPSAHMPPSAFVDFLQNHDQIGNRAFGDRITTLATPEMVEALLAILLLSPHIPLLYMGEEWGETRPFNFFTDFHDELGDAVREGRRREFAKWPAFADPQTREKIPDPNSEKTFLGSKLDWDKVQQPVHRARFDLVKELLAVRRDEIAPRSGHIGGNAGEAERLGDRGFRVTWRLQGGGTLSLLANLGDQPVAIGAAPSGRVLHAHGTGKGGDLASTGLAAGTVVLALDERRGAEPAR